MKTFITTATLAIACFGALAQEASPAPEFDHFVSTRTRAEVRAELAAAIANGSYRPQSEASYAPEFERLTSQRSRADVKAEVRQAIARGERLSYGEGGPDANTDRRANAAASEAMAQRNANPVR